MKRAYLKIQNKIERDINNYNYFKKKIGVKYQQFKSLKDDFKETHFNFKDNFDEMDFNFKKESNEMSFNINDWFRELKFKDEFK